MQIHIFSIFDSKAESFIQPFYAPTKQVGIRNFAHAANTPDTDFSRFPGDYTLFGIGTFDTDTGLIEQQPTHENLGLAITHIKESRTEMVMGKDFPRAIQGGE